MSTQRNPQTNVSPAMVKAMADASTNAKAPSLPPMVTAPAAPATPDITAQLAAMQAMMQQLMDTNAQLAQQNAELKSAKPAAKATPKSPITCKNCTWEHDKKTDELVIRVKLHADILDDAGNPKVSKNGTGNTTGVAQLSGSLEDKNGRKVGISLNAYHKF